MTEDKLDSLLDLVEVGVDGDESDARCEIHGGMSKLHARIKELEGRADGASRLAADIEHVIASHKHWRDHDS